MRILKLELCLSAVVRHDNCLTERILIVMLNIFKLPNYFVCHVKYLSFCK